MDDSIETKFIPVEVPDESHPGRGLIRFLTMDEINEINDWYLKAVKGRTSI